MSGRDEKKPVADDKKPNLNEAKGATETTDAPAFRTGNPIQAVQEATQAQCGAIICFGCSIGRHCRGTGGRRISTDAAGKCGVQVLQQQYASIR